MNPYEILGIPVNANTKEIEAASESLIVREYLSLKPEEDASFFKSKLEKISKARHLALTNVNNEEYHNSFKQSLIYSEEDRKKVYAITSYLTLFGKVSYQIKKYNQENKPNEMLGILQPYLEVIAIELKKIINLKTSFSDDKDYNRNLEFLYNLWQMFEKFIADLRRISSDTIRYEIFPVLGCTSKVVGLCNALAISYDFYEAFYELSDNLTEYARVSDYLYSTNPEARKHYQKYFSTKDLASQFYNENKGPKENLSIDEIISLCDNGAFDHYLQEQEQSIEKRVFNI